MNVTSRAMGLFQRSMRPWRKLEAIRMHPLTAKKVDYENQDLHHILLPYGQGMVPCGTMPEANQIHFLNGLPLVRDPRMPIGMICITYTAKNSR